MAYADPTVSLNSTNVVYACNTTILLPLCYYYYFLGMCVGNADGLGTVRKEELYRACAVLNVFTPSDKEYLEALLEPLFW